MKAILGWHHDDCTKRALTGQLRVVPALAPTLAEAIRRTAVVVDWLEMMQLTCQQQSSSAIPGVIEIFQMRDYGRDAEMPRVYAIAQIKRMARAELRCLMQRVRYEWKTALAARFLALPRSERAKK